MLAEITKKEEVNHILSFYSKSEWDRLVKALILYGAKQLLANYDLQNMTVRQIENIAMGVNAKGKVIKEHHKSRPEELTAGPSMVEFEDQPKEHEYEKPHGHQSEFDILAKEIKDIKSKLVHLDDKVNEKFVSAEKPAESISQHRESTHESQKSPNKTKKQHHHHKKHKESYKTQIYPSWWANSSLSNKSQQDAQIGQKWESVEWRKKHELDCTNVARECLKQNIIASTRRPVRMVFDKKEFSGPYVNREPHPTIVAKRVPATSGGNSMVERSNHVPPPPPPQDDYYEQAQPPQQPTIESPSVPKMVESCADSPIIKYFSNEYHEKDQEGKEIPSVSESKSIEAYYSSDMPREKSKDEVLGMHPGSRKTTGAYNYPL